ncbi:hypothetical protein FRC04_002406 [Tulasnella sp. 424]|nr:hypothetical protein FRC04_002406 [Tulasnella sp. 424]
MDEDPGLPPGTPPKANLDGPYWLQTTMALASAIGLTSFLLFSYCRTRWPIHFASRTKLVDFSPHDALAHQTFFGWILPTLRISEFAVLQIVGLDAAVLLSFLKMSFYLFSICAGLAVMILMPINYRVNGRIDTNDPEDGDDHDWFSSFQKDGNGTNPNQPKKPGFFEGGLDWLDLISETNSYLTIPFLFTFIFSLLALRFLNQNYRRFIRARQLFSLELVHSIAARTVMVTNLPNHLQGERALAVYFENMNLPVESVNVVREVGSLKELIDKRTGVLLELESYWTNYVGNPSTVAGYDPSQNVRTDTTLLVDVDSEAQRNRLVIPHRERPTLRPGWFKKSVDALECLEASFRDADEQVLKKRKTGKFKSTHVAFVTFETMSSAQIASQVVHAPYHSQCLTIPAPEPRGSEKYASIRNAPEPNRILPIDIVWSNMTHSPGELKFREFFVMGLMALLLLFWLVPVSALSALLSYEEIKRVAPWLAELIDKNEVVRSLVQTFLPSLAVISLNATLPFLLEAFCYIEGQRARSWVEYSLLKKYFLFLLINVVFIFLLASTYWNLLRDLANSPATIPQKLAIALQRGSAKHFFLNYVVLQAFGIMPLQLLNLGVVLPKMFYRMFLTRTPRDFAELNAPPMVNYGAVYPQAILVFVITLLYSVIQPLILVFGAIYFGVAYVVYKYKLLFVFYKPYESRGQAWPITFNRCIWGVVLFQILMTGIFGLKKKLIFTFLMAPLIAFTCYWGWTTDRDFGPQSSFVSLSSVFEVQRGEATNEVAKMRMGHPVSMSSSTLNRRRYAQNDETLYVAPEEETTDYSQPPMTDWYYGVLNTGKRRYGHPALTGVLPQPWLPLKKGQTLANYLNRRGQDDAKDEDDNKDAVVLTLRRKPSKTQLRGAGRKRNSAANLLSGSNLGSPRATTENLSPQGEYPQPDIENGLGSSTSNPWRELRADPDARARHRLSFDAATGVIMLPEEDWYEDEAEASSAISSSEEGTSDSDYGDATSRREQSVAQDIAGPASVRTASHVGSPTRRHSTYYHHPERSRRRTMPGAFT